MKSDQNLTEIQSTDTNFLSSVPIQLNSNLNSNPLAPIQCASKKLNINQSAPTQFIPIPNIQSSSIQVNSIQSLPTPKANISMKNNNTNNNENIFKFVKNQKILPW